MLGSLMWCGVTQVMLVNVMLRCFSLSLFQVPFGIAQIGKGAVVPPPTPACVSLEIIVFIMPSGSTNILKFFIPHHVSHCSIPERDHAAQLRLPQPRVRDDGAGVLHPARAVLPRQGLARRECSAMRLDCWTGCMRVSCCVGNDMTPSQSVICSLFD